MAKVRIVHQPTGLLNGKSWPAAGETIDIPDVVADAMVEAGHVERVAKAPVEKRPAAHKAAEKRKTS